MEKNKDYFRNIKINKGIKIKSKIKRIRAKMKIKYMINFNRRTKMKKIQTSITKTLRYLKQNPKLKE